MKISESIAREIMDLIEESGGIAEIKRNDFAMRLGCVPSQINYVLTSRFTPKQGFVVESRRGGGGYIRITQVGSDKIGQIMHIINSLGDSISYYSARSILINLCYQGNIEKKAAGIVLSAISDSALKEAPPDIRDRIRADIFKNALLTAV